MNGIAQLFRALVMETVALVLLFWLAFHHTFTASPEASSVAAHQPPALKIRTAPSPVDEYPLARKPIKQDPTSRAAEVLQSASQRVGAATRNVYETGFRLKKPLPGRDQRARDPFKSLPMLRR